MRSCLLAASCSLPLAALNNPQIASAASTADSNAIRPFHVNVPQKEIDDLRKRILATRWPDKETVADASQGVQLATPRALVSYWGNGYDWRKCEKKLNSYPQFITNIDGLDIHFIHVRSKNPNALPMIVRALIDDVSDLFLAILTNGKVTGDNVGPHNDFLDEFPYQGPPHINR